MTKSTQNKDYDHPKHPSSLIIVFTVYKIGTIGQ